MEPEESATAKSTGFQEENDMSMPDAILFHVLASRYPNLVLVTVKVEETIIC
jgi:hypothetical protein